MNGPPNQFSSLIPFCWRFYEVSAFSTSNLSTLNLTNVSFLVYQGVFNPILGGGGHYGPDDRERPRCFRRVRATTTKIHDFVSVYVWMVPWKSFLGFVFKIFEKRKKIFLTILTPKGPPFGKKIKKIKNFCFFPKNHTISTWIWILHVLSFLLRYITSIFLKFSFF